MDISELYKLSSSPSSSSSSSSPSSSPRSGELRTQNLKSHLVRTQSLNVLPLKPRVGQYMAIHAAAETAAKTAEAAETAATAQTEQLSLIHI